MYYLDYFDGLRGILQQVEDTQGEVIQAVAKRCAEAIAAERWGGGMGVGIRF